MILVFHDNIHEMRYDVIASACRMSNVECKPLENKYFRSLKKENITKVILIVHPGNYIKALKIIMLCIFYRHNVVLDFYDLHLVRYKNQKVPIKILIIEILLIFKVKEHITRSGEMIRLRKNYPWFLKSKKIIFVPDLDYQECDLNFIKYNPTSFILFCGTYVANFDKFVENHKDKKIITFGVHSHYKDYMNLAENIEFRESLKLNFDTLQNFPNNKMVGIHFVDMGRKLFRYSAAIKYLSYLKAGMHICTDKCHRIARFYPYLYPGRIIFNGEEIDQNPVGADPVKRSKRRLRMVYQYVGEFFHE